MAPRIISLDINIFEEDPELHFDIISLISACGLITNSNAYLKTLNLLRGDSEEFSSIGARNNRAHSAHLFAEIMPSAEHSFSDEAYISCRCEPQALDCKEIYGGSLAVHTVDRSTKKKLYAEDRVTIMPLLL